MPPTMLAREQTYEVARAPEVPELRGDWDSPAWGPVTPLELTHFHPDSSDHHPRTQAKVVYRDDMLHVHFRVLEDRYVLSRHTEPHSSVCRDSCVEFFVQPHPNRGYFNFEINAGGTILLHYNVKPSGVAMRFRQWVPVSDDWLAQIPIYHSMPRRIDEELPGPVTWHIEYAVPLALFESYAGPLESLSPGPGVQWRANWYKCADASTRPHWGSWACIGKERNFHQPERFGVMRFGE